jgi:hypothetical protein
MDSKQFDSIVKSFGTAASRRRVLRGATAAALGALGLGVGRAAAAPQICVSCVCGVGKPCNVKGGPICSTTRGFPSPERACQVACEQQGFKFCGGVTQFHCPRGCV